MSEQRVAIVTGGGSGIGLAISQRLASDGHAVAVLDLSEEAAAAAAKDIDAAGGKAIGVPADVSDRAQVFVAVDDVRGQLGRPAILVNNAGMGASFNRFLKITPEEWDRTVAVNLNGAFHCCQAVLPDMVEARWGRIVNISSSSAHSGQALLSP
jgi:2-hydroxycyclohexanecarboxyl-CoA dehydrogenase